MEAPPFDPVSFLKDMIRFPSLSREEKAIADFLFNLVPGSLVNKERHEDNLVFSLGEGDDVLLLNSHLDVVPASSNHPFDPFDPVEHEGSIYGRGSVDAKASGATMMCALLNLAAGGWQPASGRVIVALTTCEEIGGDYNGMERVRTHLPPLSAAIVGEPTCLQPCVAQKGILILKAVASGKTAHAARAHLGSNAITMAARDLLKVDAMAFEKADPFLGSPTINATTIEGGTARNVIPDRCSFYLDIRSTPAYSHDELIDLVQDRLESEIRVHSKRYIPVATDTSARIVQSAVKHSPIPTPFGSPTASDWVHLHDIPTVKLGPGPSERSHTPEEHIEIDELYRAVETYTGIIKDFFEND